MWPSLPAELHCTIRSQVLSYERAMLAMTCKAENAARARPPYSPVTRANQRRLFLRYALRSNAWDIVERILKRLPEQSWDVICTTLQI